MGCKGHQLPENMSDVLHVKELWGERASRAGRSGSTAHPGLCREADRCKPQGHTDVLVVSGRCQLMESSEDMGRDRALVAGLLPCETQGWLRLSRWSLLVRGLPPLASGTGFLSSPRRPAGGTTATPGSGSTLPGFSTPAAASRTAPLRTVYYTDSAICLLRGRQECLRG